MVRFMILMALFFSAFSYSETNVNQQLLDRIAKSKQQLMAIEKQVNQQSFSYQKQINQALNDVKALRDKALAIQRVADEQILSVEQLSERVEKWRARHGWHCGRRDSHNVSQPGRIDRSNHEPKLAAATSRANSCTVHASALCAARNSVWRYERFARGRVVIRD